MHTQCVYTALLGQHARQVTPHSRRRGDVLSQELRRPGTPVPLPRKTPVLGYIRLFHAILGLYRAVLGLY